MNKTLLKMALLTSIITPSVKASADDSRQILALLQQMQTSLTQLHSKVDTLETRLGTLEQEKSSALTKTQPTLVTEPTQQTAALSSSIADDTTPDHEEMILAILKEIQQTYPWFNLCADSFQYDNPQKVISLLDKIKAAGTNKEQLQDIRSRIEEGGDLYINEMLTYDLKGFLDVILSPHLELLQKLLSYDHGIYSKRLSSNSLRANNLSDLENAIRSNVISIDNISLSGKVIPEAENMLIGLMKEGFFNEVKILDFRSPHLNNLCDLAINLMLQGNFKNIRGFNIYCDNLVKAKKIASEVIEAKKAGKLNKLYNLSFNYQLEDASKSDPESQELRNGLEQLGVHTNLANPW